MVSFITQSPHSRGIRPGSKEEEEEEEAAPADGSTGMITLTLLGSTGREIGGGLTVNSRPVTRSMVGG